MVNRIELGTIDAPKVVLAIDGSDNLVIEDADGNTIVRLNQDQTTEFFANVLPDTDGSHDLGADATRWANVFADAVDTADLDIDGTNYLASGDISLNGPPAGSYDDNQSTTSTSYVTGPARLKTIWNTWAQSNSVVLTWLTLATSAGDVRVRNTTDGETIHEELDASAGSDIELGPTVYTPTTAGSMIDIDMQFRTNDGGTGTAILRGTVHTGVQV